MLMKRLVAKIFRIYERICVLFLRPIMIRDSLAAQNVKVPNERLVEYSFALRNINDFKKFSVIDIGTGKSPIGSLLQVCGVKSRCVDSGGGYWNRELSNRYSLIEKGDILNSKIRSKYSNVDAITCISVLEHIDDYESAFQNMVGMLSENGILILTVPLSATHPIDNIYEHPESTAGPNLPYICRLFSLEQIDELAMASNVKVLKKERWKITDHEFHSCGTTIYPYTESAVSELFNLGCFVIGKR